MSFDDGFMLGLMMGGDGSGGGGDDVNIVNGSDSSITISVVTGRNSDDPDYNMERFTFAIEKSYKITTIKSKSKIITKTWTKNTVTSVTNSKGEKLFTMDTDGYGKIIACYDRSGNEILRGGTFEESVFTTTPEGIALGWALAYSKEQDEQVENAVNDYIQGRQDDKDAQENNNDPTDIEEITLPGGFSSYHYEKNFASRRNLKYTWHCEYIVLTLNSSGDIKEAFLKGVTYYSETGDVKSPYNTTLVRGRDEAIDDAWLIQLTGVVYADKNGTPYTGEYIWTNPAKQPPPGII